MDPDQDLSWRVNTGRDSDPTSCLFREIFTIIISNPDLDPTGQGITDPDPEMDSIGQVISGIESCAKLYARS